MLLIESVPREYAWGSRTALPQLLGIAPTGRPLAELWYGAHRSAPSKVRGEPDTTLDAVIAASPAECLGPALERFGPTLPFLLKLIAAEEPLSLQMHPTHTQALTGFAAEEARGLDLHAPERHFRDQQAKPEVLCAVTRFEALVGLRDYSQSRALAESLALPLPALDGGIRACIEALLRLPPTDTQWLVDALQCAPFPPEHLRHAEWLHQLAARYPDDPGVLVAVFMNYVCLEPGEAMAIHPGELHAYLGGVGVEAMGNSDNVQRAGLTAKHIDRETLLRMFDPTPRPPRIFRPQGASMVCDTGDAEFELSRHALQGETLTLTRRGPELFLVVEGEVEVTSERGEKHHLRCGDALFAAAADGKLSVCARGLCFRVQVGP